MKGSELVYQAILNIPEGKVVTYGDVGNLVGINPRVVGWILTGMSEIESEKYPWQRVVAKGGIISTLKLGSRGLLQVALLQKEGLTIRDGQILDYESVKWEFPLDLGE